MDFKSIERRWQKKWEEAQVFKSEDGKGKKFYVLEMYPYPSASGLHMGHAFNYTIGDVYARFKRMQGFNVLYPMGYDSFGLPAENAAIKAKSHPKIFVEKAIKNYIKQQKALGLSYDWGRMFFSHDPEYYKWDQWIFLQMLKKDLAYRKKSPVNYCPKCKTVLANEQVNDGKCWRHKTTNVEIRQLEQWFFKTTAYAEELYENIDKLKNWPERIKIMQKHWIGKSEGVDIHFKLDGIDKILPTYTTRCDTIFSVTFLAIAPENPLLDELIKGTKDEAKVKKFAQKLARESLADRINEKKEKKGIFTGRYAINPINNEKIPIWVSNFALMYGSGIVMCDAHDKRDFKFAKKYKIPLKFVISKDGKEVNANKAKEAFTDDGILFGSDKFDGMKNREALPKIAKYIEDKKFGKRTVNYKLKDWLVSRQRYWGTPIPVVYCDKCGVVPVPEKDLPVKLPKKMGFSKDWIETTCPKCNGKAKRETDTMDTFVNSSWYFLRYTDPRNTKEPFSKKKAKYWVPVDIYIGGAEHACMHLIYFRFYTKFLRDIGLLDIDEPTQYLFNQGMLHGEDGFVMSKSRGNVVLPETVSEKYGIDTARLFLVSMASPDKDVSWSTAGIEGSLRFIRKVFNYFNHVKIGEDSKKVESKINQAIKEITDHIEKLEYNYAIIKLRQLLDSLEQEVSKKTLESFLKLLSPFCPHITEELWLKLVNKPFISTSKWPKAHESKINNKFEEQEQAIEKIKQDINNIKKLLKKENPKVYLYVIPKDLDVYMRAAEKIQKSCAAALVKVFAVNDSKKIDPENKAKKAKPGKPAIYLE